MACEGRMASHSPGMAENSPRAWSRACERAAGSPSNRAPYAILWYAET